MEQQKFKKFDLSFVLLFIGINAGIPLILGILLGLINIENFLEIVFTVFIFLCILSTFISLLMLPWGKFSMPFMKKTAKKLDNENFTIDYSYYSKIMVFVDIKGGKTAAISCYNPLKIQMFHSNRITNLEVDTRENAGDSAGVRLNFIIDDNKISIDTLITNTALSMDDTKVVNAINAAEKIKQIFEISASNCVN